MRPTRKTRLNNRPLSLLRLEDRTVPAVFFVTDTFDTGTGSLRNAITNAKNFAGPDTIQFFSVTGTITLTSRQLAISDTDGLEIQGPGADKLTITGNGASRTFNTSGSTAGVAINLSGMTITGGNAAGGGGVLVGDEAVTLNNCVVSNNTST